jgi:BirA family transcriptional regulator, biotin operon repressor / biotin---[acetyl-CoA-carboxylase] ligase
MTTPAQTRPAVIPLDTWEGQPGTYWRARWAVPELHLYQRVASTMDLARALAEDGAPAGTVVLTEEQTAGRGRAGRRWEAAPGASLLLSIIVRPRPRPGTSLAPGALPLRTGCAVIAALEAVAGVQGWIKWPNDIVLPGHGKLAGILCEGSLAADGGYVVVGIGVNTSQPPKDWSAELRGAATSVQAATGRNADRAALAETIIQHLSYRMDDCARPLGPETMRQLEARDLLRGRPITVDDTPRGTAHGFTSDGALRVRSTDGREHVIRNGTVRVPPDHETPSSEFEPHDTDSQRKS